MMFKADQPTGRGYASAVLLWFVVALAAAHGVLGAISPARAFRLQTDSIGAAGQRTGDPAGGRTSLINHQRLVAIAEWRGLAQKSQLPVGDAGPAILPSASWHVAAALRPCLSETVPESLHEAGALVHRARAPPLAA
ncbi:hypothetical protein [Mesorhizobium sp. KR1-2]|uniref:hypothetical protein n=1 Tax=Mesorhizobium sp. KR1-2 TaxID=3156609 RepID=UPI0032B53AD7